MNLDEYITMAQDLVDSYQDRNTLYANIDKMFYLDWSFPDGIPDWVIKSVSTDPHDAVLTTVRTFATLRPRFKVMPMLNNEANRNRANEIETALSWNFKNAGKRNDSKIEWDVMMSASMYAEVAAQVIYLPYQEKVLEAMGKDARRLKATKRFGDFAFIIHHPGNVYPLWSEYGLEGVLTCRVQTVDEFKSTWGKLANKVGEEVTYVTSWDYIDYETRCVWAIPTDTNTAKVEGNGVEILKEENKLGFIPYAIKRWGNSLSANTNERVMPLLQSIYQSGQWDALNLMDSFDISLTLKRVAAARFAAEVPPGQDLEMDNTQPEGWLPLPQGTRNFTPLPTQTPDMRLSQQKAEHKGAIWQSTVARALQTLEFPGGTAYSTVNQLLSTATNSLSPYKILGENTLAEVAHLMLCWGKYYNKEYKGGTSLYGQYDDKTRMGQEVSLAWDTIDPDSLQIEAILTPDMPVDRLQQINGAVLLKQNFRVPEAELLEDLGMGDPNEMAKRRNLEDYQTAYIAADLQRIQMAPQLEAQQMQVQQQMEMQGQQMQQEMAAREQEAMMKQAGENGSPAQEQMQGLGMNPAAGGMPPVNMARGQR